MNYLRNLVCSVGCTLVVLGNATPAKSAFCSGFFQIPLTKARFNQLAFGAGFEFYQFGDVFDNFARDTINPDQPIPSNTKPYESEQRNRFTDGQYSNVVPDGVLPLIIKRIGQPDEIFEKSVFYESKALQPTVIGLNYPDPPGNEDPEVGRFQIIGFVEALTKSPAAPSGTGVPALIFLTTSGVTIGEDVLADAFFQNIAVWQSIACEDLLSRTLQMTEADALNPGVYLDEFLFQGIIPFPVGPGRPMRIGDLRYAANPDQQQTALTVLDRKDNASQVSYDLLKQNYLSTSPLAKGKSKKMLDPIISQVYEEGMTKARARDYQGALDALNKVISAYPNYARAYVARGYLRRQLKQYEYAYSDFEKAASISTLQGKPKGAELLQKEMKDTKKHLKQ